MLWYDRIDVFEGIDAKHGAAYRCIISRISKSEAIKLIKALVWLKRAECIRHKNLL